MHLESSGTRNDSTMQLMQVRKQRNMILEDELQGFFHTLFCLVFLGFKIGLESFGS